MGSATGAEVAAARADAPGALGEPPRSRDQLDRILEATIDCVARWGVAKTTIDDVARRAGCSRATVYRVVPGGREALLDAAAEHELARFYLRLATALDGAEGLTELLVTAVHEAATWAAESAVLRFVLANEPEQVLPMLSFDALDPLLGDAAAFARPWFGAHLAADRADELVEHLTRVIVSYTLEPPEGMDLTDRATARRLVEAHLVPVALAAGATAA